MSNELEALNTLCRELYESIDPAQRYRAEQNLSELAESGECLQRCTLLMDQGVVPYGPMVATKTLMKLLNTKTGIMPAERLELCRYILGYLGSRASSLPPFVVSEICQLFARLTKLEWTHFDPQTQEYPFRAPIDSIVKTISMENIDESLLAVQVLSLLVVDVNSPVGMESVSAHRKSSSTFRDQNLFTIFQLTITLLEESLDRKLNDAQMQLTLAVLELCLNCLLFDFIGSLADETSEDNYNVQVPTGWRNAFTDGKLVRMMFSLYTQLPQRATEKIMQILVQLASIRRTLFNGQERQAYLKELIVGSKMVLENPRNLSEQGAFHEFSRLIARLKTNFQLCEMLKIDEYAATLRLLAEFTVQSLQAMEFSANSSYFLLTFWQRMVSSVPYIRTQDDHFLNVYCPEIFKAYVESRLAFVEKVVRDGAEDPLEDQGAILQVMEQLAIICRCEYKKTFDLLIYCFDENAGIVEQGPEGDIRMRIAEGRLVWLTTLIGTAIFGKTTSNANEEYDKLDGEMISRALKFMQWNDERLVFKGANQDPGKGNVRLEVAFVHLLEQFRRAYIMDQVSRAPFVYNSLQPLGISDETDMLNVIVRKIITNLKMWATNDHILDLSLSLLKDLSLGYTAVRKLFRLPDIQLLLNNHTSEHFSFLGSEIDYKTMKHRTTFYEALTRLLTTDLNDDEGVFGRYMQPLSDTVHGICEVMNTSNSDVKVEHVQRALVGLCRDVRGVAIACTSKVLFQILIDWLYPDVFNVLHRAVDVWADVPEVTTPVFRLLAELCQNRQQRLKFEMSSCSAVLLFREVSKILCTWGNRMLQLPTVPKDRVYKERFKNVGIIFSVLKQALSGAYVPFGVFRLYGDTCLQDALEMFVKLFRAIPEEDFHSYSKIAQNYYHLLEAVVNDNMSFVSNLDADVFAAIVRSVTQGVLSLDAIVITSACSSLDTILNYLYKRLTRQAPLTKASVEPDGDGCLRAIENNPQLLAELLAGMLSSLMFGEVKCQWSMSRPLLGLILLQEEVYTRIKADILAQQPANRHASFEQAFIALMEGVEPNLSIKNKDTFTQNLAKFRRDVIDIVKGKELSPSASNANMMM